MVGVVVVEDSIAGLGGSRGNRGVAVVEDSIVVEALHMVGVVVVEDSTVAGSSRPPVATRMLSILRRRMTATLSSVAAVWTASA